MDFGLNTTSRYMLFEPNENDPYHHVQSKNNKQVKQRDKLGGFMAEGRTGRLETMCQLMEKEPTFQGPLRKRPNVLWQSKFKNII
jgi:hypothetical protein